MVTSYNGMDPEQPDKTSEEFDEDSEPELPGDEVGQASSFRRDPSERRFRLFHLLSANDLTRQDIFGRMGEYYQVNDDDDRAVSLSSQRAGKMLLRDLQFLERVGYQVEKQRKDNATFYRLSSGPFPQFHFNEHELEALALLHTLFADPTKYTPSPSEFPLPAQPPQNPFAEEILSLIERLVATLPSKQKRTFDTWIRKPYVYLNLDIVTDYLPHRATIDKLIRAISQRQQISFDYAPMHRPFSATPHKHVDPYYITRQEGHLYLIGYSHNPFNTNLNKFFEYRVDRIVTESITILPQMIDGTRQRKPIEFRFWLDASLAKSSLSQRWLFQTVEQDEVMHENGRPVHRLLIRAQAYSDFHIIQQLLKYGSKVELIDPPDLREKMRREVDRLHNLYNSQ
ncbi:MAG: WYL domain-containing protein [Chloroflexota bacterium]|nr:WYL domain-containing protein [Chloroflexota bacterium]